MSTERVYSPENEPFDVTPNRAAFLCLERGWTKTPFERVAVPEVIPAPVFDADAESEIEAIATQAPARGRGRRRRAVEAVPADVIADHDESWRS